MKTYNIGIIGFGFMGKTHTYCLQNIPLFYDNLPYKIKLHSVCVTDQGRANAIAAQHGFAHGTSDYAQLIANPEIDIISITTPNYLHYPQLKQAIAAGKHIYCEKPLTATYAEAEEIAALATAKGIIGQTVFHNRFFPSVIKAKELMPRLGRILSFRCNYLHSGNNDHTKAVSWKQKKEICGGGVLHDLGSHAIDMIYHLIGSFAEVKSVLQTAYPDRVSTEEAVYMLAKMECGAIGTIEASKIATGNDDSLTFEINGDAGAVKFDLMKPDHLYYYDNSAAEKGFTAIETVGRFGSISSFPSPKSTIGWLRGHMHSMYSFLQCVHESKQPSPSLADGAYVQKVMDMALNNQVIL